MTRCESKVLSVTFFLVVEGERGIIFFKSLGSVDLSRLFLQRIIGYLYKAEPLSCGCSG